MKEIRTDFHFSDQPGQELRAALNAASRGEMPLFSAEELCTALKLDSDEPDGKDFRDRLLSEQDIAVSINVRLGFWLPFAVRTLRRVTNERRANPAQEAIASMLGQAVSQHVRREGNLEECTANRVLESMREDIIPPDIIRHVEEIQAAREIGDV